MTHLDGLRSWAERVKREAFEHMDSFGEDFEFNEELETMIEYCDDIIGAVDDHEPAELNFEVVG